MGTDAQGHRYFEGMAVVHVLGGLDESDGRVFRSHLLECSDCRARVGELRALAHDLADVERDEERRRARAAKSLETKRREYSDEDDVEEEVLPAAPGGLRFPRLLALLGLTVLMGLAAWNLTLRSTIAEHQAQVDTLTEAAAVMEFGREVDWTATSDDVDARIRMADGKLAVIVSGLSESPAVHAINQEDADGDAVGVVPVQVKKGRIHYLITPHEDARRITLVRRASRAEQGVDEMILTARLPTDG